jgi:hypothetical protein
MAELRRRARESPKADLEFRSGLREAIFLIEKTASEVGMMPSEIKAIETLFCERARSAIRAYLQDKILVPGDTLTLSFSLKYPDEIVRVILAGGGEAEEAK